MFIDGSYSVLYIKHDGVFLPIGCLTSNSFSEETESLDSTTRDNNGWKTNRLTNQSYNISFEGIEIEDYTSTTLFTFHRLTKIKRDRQLVEWKIQGKDENYEYGVGFITSLSNDSSVDELSSFSGEIVGYGSPYDYLEKIIKDYENRIIANNGTIEVLDCLRKSIEEIISEETKPKLALIPSGYGANKVYSVLPSNGAGDFDFSRSGSATRINKDGLIETVASNVPRLNYPMIDGVVSGCPSLLLEPQRTNLVTYSEDFDNAYWTKSGASVTSGFVSPNGTNNAFKLVESSANSGHFIKRRIDTSSSFLSNSIFVKAGEVTKIGISESGSTDDYASFNLSNGVIIASGGNPSFSIKKMSNDWYRISLKSDTQLSRNDFNLALLSDDYVSGVPYSQSYQGDGTSGVYIFGAQLESGDLSSYIPTQGTIQTRVQETASGSGNSEVFNDSQGSLFLNINTSDTSAVPVISLSNGSFSNEIEFAYYGTNQFNFILRVSGGTPNVVGNIVGNSFSKFCVTYTTTDFKVYLNGFLIGSNTLPSPLSGLNVLDFNLPNGLNNFYGKTKELAYYDTALTDLELETLTSYRTWESMVKELNLNIIHNE